MSYCRAEGDGREAKQKKQVIGGKDKIIFATEEYLSEPSTAILLPDDPDVIDTSNAGAILPDGTINWDCPCLGNLPNGPCGPSFREAFSCWVENRDNDQGFADNCFDNFTSWEKCLGENRDIYKQSGDDEPRDASRSEVVATEPELPSENKSQLQDDIKSIENDSQEVAIKETRAIAAASTSPPKS